LILKVGLMTLEIRVQMC